MAPFPLVSKLLCAMLISPLMKIMPSLSAQQLRCFRPGVLICHAQAVAATGLIGIIRALHMLAL